MDNSCFWFTKTGRHDLAEILLSAIKHKKINQTKIPHFIFIL
jgi:hypothetical protein